MNRVKMPLWKNCGFDPDEKPAFFKLRQDRPDPHRRFHIPAFMHVMDLVPFIDHQGDRLDQTALHLRLRGLGFHIAEFSQGHWIFPEGGDHLFHVFRRAEIPVLALQNRPDHFSGEPAAQRVILIQAVVDQIRHAGVFGG